LRVYPFYFYHYPVRTSYLGFRKEVSCCKGCVEGFVLAGGWFKGAVCEPVGGTVVFVFPLDGWTALLLLL
jgi:hypothetical protein